MRDPQSRRPVRVLIVGGGAAGVVAAAALLRQGGRVPVDVRIVERRDVVGPGLAYRTTEPLHLLNNYAGRMSALPGEPDDLLSWCAQEGVDATADTFLPRHVYGRYLAGLLDRVAVPAGSRLSRLRGEVVDLDDTGSDYRATIASGWRMHADVVVLALGNPPPRRPPGLCLDVIDTVVDDPWAPGLVDAVPDDGRVLLVGTGLTMVDLAVQICAARPLARLTAVSRHRLLPRPHLPVDGGPVPPYDADDSSLAAVMAAVRRAADRGQDWRSEVEAVKGVANDLWRRLSLDERGRFVSHVARYWEVARHRMAPATAAAVDDLLASRRLVVAAPEDVDTTTFDLAVNCTGWGSVCAPGWNPLVDRLAVKGMLWPGPHSLGVDVDLAGALLDAHGLRARGLYALGAARRGAEWEVAAVPDLRRQACAMAQDIGRPVLEGIAG